MAVNTNEKQRRSLREPNNNSAIVTPDVESLLNNDL